MAAPITGDELLEVIRKSNQIDCRQLSLFVESHSAVGSMNPRKLAALLVREQIVTIFQAEQFLLGKHRGFYLGGYRIVERIGRGDNGTVYRAEHQAMRRWVAIKVLPQKIADESETRERFRREAVATGLLDHPNIVHVYDFLDEGGMNAIVMEYVQGRNLQEIINAKGPLPLGTACLYARQAAYGLHHIHQAGMVHRDIKPANLMLDRSGMIKILDLGLARCQIEGENPLTRKIRRDDLLMVMADYLPPEQALSMHDVDHRTDIYALGATLYALLAGRPPFSEGNFGQKLAWHQNRSPERLDTLRPDIPSELAQLVARMLAKRMENRPANCAAVAADLEMWSDPLPVPHRGDYMTAPRNTTLNASGFSTSSPDIQIVSEARAWADRAETETNHAQNQQQTQPIIPVLSLPDSPQQGRDDEETSPASPLNQLQIVSQPTQRGNDEQVGERYQSHTSQSVNDTTRRHSQRKSIFDWLAQWFIQKR